MVESRVKPSKSGLPLQVAQGSLYPALYRLEQSEARRAARIDPMQVLRTE